MNVTDSLNIELLRNNVEILENQVNNLKGLLSHSNDTIANEIAISDRFLSIASFVFALTALLIGVYITWCSNKMDKMKKSVEQKEQDIIRLKEIVESTNRQIQDDIHGVYERLRLEETNTLIERLRQVPEDISNIINLLLSRDLPETSFSILREAYDKVDNPAYIKDYFMLFFQHFADRILKDLKLRSYLIENINELVQYAFKNDIIKTTDDIVNSMSCMQIFEKKQVLVPYYKALKNSQFKDLTCLYDKLKSTVTNEEWQEILKEVGDEPDKEDE